MTNVPLASEWSQMSLRNIALATGTPGTCVAMVKEMIDDLHFKFVRLQGGKDKYTIAELHIYPKLCFVKKADPASRLSK